MYVFPRLGCSYSPLFDNLKWHPISLLFLVLAGSKYSYASVLIRTFKPKAQYCKRTHLKFVFRMCIFLNVTIYSAYQRTNKKEFFFLFTEVDGNGDKVASTGGSCKLTPPPYRMPPQPLYSEPASIPGSATPSIQQMHTHSNKFPVSNPTPTLCLRILR